MNPPFAAPQGAPAGGQVGPRGRSIPAFALYGENSPALPEPLHIEEIALRSSRYEWEIEPHVHRGLYQVVWVGEGRAEVALDDLQQAVSGPAAIVVPPETVHGFSFAPGTQGWVLTLDGRFLVEGELQTAGDSLRRLFSRARVLCFSATAEAEPTRRLQGLLRQLGEEFASPGAIESPVVRWLAQAVVWRLARDAERHESDASLGPQARRHQALLTRFLLLVESHFLEHWPLGRYASQLGMSTPSLNRLTRAASGRAALEYPHERLCREACRRVIYTAASIGRIALDLGFQDPAYFCRFFKRRLGETPGDYRARHGA